MEVNSKKLFSHLTENERRVIPLDYQFSEIIGNENKEYTVSVGESVSNKYHDSDYPVIFPYFHLSRILNKPPK